MVTGANHHPHHALRAAVARHANAQQAMVAAARELLPPIVTPEPAPATEGGSNHAAQ